MPPREKKTYSKPEVRAFASRDDLLKHFAERGDPQKFAKVHKLVRDAEKVEAEQPTKLASKR